jgi:hypothetical protein
MEKKREVEAGGAIINLAAYIAAGYRVEEIHFIHISHKDSPTLITFQARLILNEALHKGGIKDFCLLQR